ncbi:hypothetical protein HPP92_001914 [Vanilla planifolia]|uniref:Uncharacterized protein n=1 Tax=Vanilla planifolia TaxID=51239 RepID=A0A835SDR3_VANPL|nr:hypothetical protein HPP92_001914 [Vanilla planifolia]
MDVQVENAQVFNAMVADGSRFLNDNTTENENSSNDLASHEKFILEEVDLYMEDLNARLIVSRMVTDSVIRGMLLYDISKSLLSLEPGFVFPHGNLEVLEERNALKRKDQPHRKQIGNCAAFFDECTQCLMEKTEGYEKHSTGDSPQLLCQTKEELIGYFKTEIAKMKRQHDIALQEKTEELFCLKHLEAALVQQSQQCSLLREHAIKQELAIVEAKVEYELAKMLRNRKHSSIQAFVNQEELSSAVVKGKEQAKHIESMVTSIFDLSNSFDGWGHKITVAVEHNESRLKVLSYQNDELLKQAGMLRKKMLCYKQVFEMRCDDLRRLRMRFSTFMHVGIWHELTSTFFSLLEN